jgi:hypothetical protein
MSVCCQCIVTFICKHAALNKKKSDFKRRTRNPFLKTGDKKLHVKLTKVKSNDEAQT